MDGHPDDQGGQRPPASYARTATKPRAREVPARYLQPKANPAARAGAGAHTTSIPLTGRASLAAYGSHGWVELQHPNHTSTPLMVPSSSVGGGGGGVFSQARPSNNGRGRGGLSQQTPAPPTTLRRGGAPRQQQHHTQQQQLVTPLPSSRAAQQQQQQLQQGDQEDVDGEHSSSYSNAASYSTCPDSVCSSTTSSMLRGAGAVLRTPAAPALSGSMAAPRPRHHQGHLGRQGAQSAVDLGAVVASQLQQRTQDLDRKAQLEAWRRQQAASGRTAAKPGVFKEPAPKATLFRATAATRASKSDTAVAAPAAPPAAAGGQPHSSQAGPCGTAPGEASGSGTPSRSADAASASPSAFSGTMAALQQSSGGKQRPGKGGSGSKAAPGSSRPSPVPLLRLDQAGLPGAAGLSPLPPGTGIPRLDLAGLPVRGHHQEQQQHAALQDATPRTLRDALPSRLPRTPRAPDAATPAHPAGQDRPPAPAVGSDSQDGHADTSSKSPWQQGLPPGAAKLAVPKLKLGALGVSLQAAAAVGLGAAPPAGSMAAGRPPGSCLSARGQAKHVPGAAPRAATPLSARRSSSSGGGGAGATPPGSKQPGSTPRGPAAGPSRLPTPRMLAGTGAAAPPAAAAAAAAAGAARRSDAEAAEDVRQQLRLLRMHQHQLRHLNAQVEAALKAKQEKVDSSIAAAAAAVVGLSGRLLQARDQVQKQAWQQQLHSVLGQQLSLLQAWSGVQAQHQAKLAELHAACNSALSHVPLLHGASLGHDPERPDLQALQRQLQQGMQLLNELQPSMQLLLTGDPTLLGSSGGGYGSSTYEVVGVASARSAAAAASGSGGGDSSGEGPSPAGKVLAHPKGVKDTAVLTQDLMEVAAEECTLLQQLSQQLAELSDLHLYANSMHVQLLHLRQLHYRGDV